MTQVAKSRAGIVKRGVGGSPRRKRRASNPIPVALIDAIQSQLGYRLGDAGIKKLASIYKINPSVHGCMAAVKRENWPWSKRTYSAKTKTWSRPKGRGRKTLSYRVHSKATRVKVGGKRKSRKRSPIAKTSGYPSLFGMPYEKLSASQQALVRKALSNKGKRKNPARKHPEGKAAERYEYFHGRGPDSVTEVTRTIHEHAVLSGIGKLRQLSIAPIDGGGVVELSGFKGALLAQNENGTQLYIEGGDQKVDLGVFGIRKPHEREVLGAVVSVVYDTTKDHLGKDGGTASYHHKFGAKRSRLPMLVYDVRNKLLEFAGGGYSLPDVGIDG